MYATIMKTVTLFTLELGNCFTYRLTDHAVFCLDFALTLKTNQGGVWLCYFSLHFMFLEQSLLLIVFYISSSSLILGKINIITAKLYDSASMSRCKLQTKAGK
uniref:Uncharacterized protein n=1 Tax=Glossina palpalis gambiensis TaxID=67801 RepID=A0A1B0BQR9_9MUSC